MLPLGSVQNRLPTMMEIGLILALLCSSCLVVTPQVSKTERITERITCELGNSTECSQSSTPSGVLTRIVRESGVSGAETENGEETEIEEEKNGLSAVASAKANKTVTADAEVVKKSEDGVTITVAAGAAVGEQQKNKTESTDAPEDVPAEVITTTLKAAIQDRDIDGVAAALKRFDDVNALAEGFKVPEDDREEILEKTPARNDADVVTIKGIARAALEDKNFVRLADVIILSLTPEDGKFPSGYSSSRIKANLLRLLANKRLMRSVLTADPAMTSRRRLLVDAGTPANSMFCAHCWKRSVCRKAVWWCS
ncbi:hypothetical protein BSKO_06104 [Bryopsis sp. KO-2023]|nr:hypothetical protein BSKO_06104 [Bryopsis sp. KO-2023]